MKLLFLHKTQKRLRYQLPASSFQLPGLPLYTEYSNNTFYLCEKRNNKEISQTCMSTNKMNVKIIICIYVKTCTRYTHTDMCTSTSVSSVRSEPRLEQKTTLPVWTTFMKYEIEHITTEHIYRCPCCSCSYLPSQTCYCFHCHSHHLCHWFAPWFYCCQKDRLCVPCHRYGAPN